MTYKLWVDPVLPFSGWLLCHYELSISRHIEPTYELRCSGPHDPRIHDLAGMITDRTTPELTAFPVSLKLSNLSGFRIWDFCQKRHLATCDLVDLLCYRNLSKTGGPPGLSIWRDFLSSKNGAVFPVTGMTWDETMLSGLGIFLDDPGRTIHQWSPGVRVNSQRFFGKLWPETNPEGSGGIRRLLGPHLPGDHMAPIFSVESLAVTMGILGILGAI